MRDTFDLLIIGGGINGAGIARDAAGRGLSVLLCEQGDLANATSSASSKLIHGGLRYLEQYRFAMVRKALAEREVLLRAAPHLVRPVRFVLPHMRRQRSAWMVRLGLFLYDHLGGRTSLPRSGPVDLGADPAGAPLVPSLRVGFQYTDCQVDDARLVVLNALDAEERGATIRTRTRLASAEREPDAWRATLHAEGGARRNVRARAVVNAAGPWVPGVGESLHGAMRPAPLRLVKGSHIVVPRWYDGGHAYLLENDDGRVVFVVPFAERHTLIGTTDVDFASDAKAVAITPEEADYLCRAVGRYFKRSVGSSDVVWSFAGLRPLFDDARIAAAEASRDYKLDADKGAGAPLLTVYGGKITTYRKLAEEALALLAAPLGVRRHGWTATAPLPGGDFADADFARFRHSVARRWPWLPDALATRYAHAYGTRIERILGGVQDLGGLGAHFGAGLYEAEARYLVHHEWAETADDILWRRTKLGLEATDATTRSLDRWLAAGAAPPGAPITADAGRVRL